MARLFLILVLLAAVAPAQWRPLDPVTAVAQETDGLVLTLKTGTLRIQVCSDSILRVRFAPAPSFPNRPDYVVIKNAWPAASWKTASTAEEVTLTTARLKVIVTRKDGAIAYSDLTGRKLITDGARWLTPATVNGENTNHAEAFFPIYGSREAFFGLGQHQAGVWNYRGESVDLSQENTNIAVPLLVSSNGYALFWNNSSRTRFNNRFVHSLYVSSEVADVVDYYFLYGPEFDRLVAGYRELTGPAPLYGRWAYGFWQSNNRYKTQAEILGVARQYRKEQIPIDDIVQDWFWWTKKGSFVWNEGYPDPKGMVEDLHRDRLHLMVSIWPFFDPGTPVYEQMDKRGYFIDRTKAPSFHPQGMALYDATNPGARAYYWKLVNDSLLKIGVDAWWLDTTEPETEGMEENVLLTSKLAIGSGARYANLYPLFATSNIYEGQRSVTDRKRVYILSRSAFAGSQRYGVTAWSGDILSDFESYKRQVPAGLNFSLSGIPYWTTDIGGFFIGNPDDPAYRELFVRWFQYGAFCPIFRVHGTRTNGQNQLWSYGAEAQKILTAFDRLRYRLLPYIYSLAWKTTSESYTPMRPLAMDFLSDSRALDIGDQFLFGPALLVNPVTEPGATSRRVYLPKARWYDFWAGSAQDGGRTIQAEAPLERIPLYVRAGSILPMGPEVQYAAERSADPLELRIYAGADGDFTLYEDEGDTYDYEKGARAVIPLHWDDARGALTIGDRRGTFPGMAQTRTFHIVFVGPGHGAGPAATAAPDKTVEYAGRALTIAR